MKIFHKIYQRQLARACASIPFNKSLGLKLTNLTDTTAQLTFEMQPNLIGNYLHEILHGGVIAGVLDMAGGMTAMNSVLNANIELSPSELKKKIGKTSAVNLNINYLRPGRGKTFIASGEIVKSGNKIIFTKMQLTNQDDELIATANGTYFSST